MTTARAVALVEVVGEEALAHADLRGREADAVLESMVSYMACDERDEVAVDLVDVARGLLQHGITEEAQRIHVPRIPARNFTDPDAGRSGQTRRGSTSMRRRPLARAASTPGAASASQSIGDRRGPEQRAVPVASGPRTVTAGRAAHRVARGRATASTAPRTSASPPNGGKPSA